MEFIIKLENLQKALIELTKSEIRVKEAKLAFEKELDADHRSDPEYILDRAKVMLADKYLRGEL